MRQLSQQSGHSRDKLYRIIYHWLSKGPDQSEVRLVQDRYLIFDGTFSHRPVSIVTVMDASKNQIIAGQYGVSEKSERQLRSFFKPLIARGLSPVSCTVDGNPQAIRVLKALWPEVIIQRYLVHIQRQGLMWCRRYPKTAMGQELRSIFLQVTGIRTKEGCAQFLESAIQ